jgi:hypothetical protein
MQQSSRRRSLVPTSLLIVLVVAAVGAVAAGFAIAYLSRPEIVSVPSLARLEQVVARSRLAQSGLGMEIGDTRFSATVPAGSVVDQDPSPGTEVEKGSIVTVVVSAGSESFAMPDVLGLPLETARGELEAKGLVVETVSEASEAPPNTILRTEPAPGGPVATGDTVVLAVVSDDVAGDVLLPADLTGLVFVLDPATAPEGEIDPAMDITRKLRSLLEASGGRVVVTRSALETAATTATRVARAAEASGAVAAIGLELSGPGESGRAVRSLRSSPETADRYLKSVTLARAIKAQLEAGGDEVASAVPVEDTVLEVVPAPGARLFVGSLEHAPDAETFAQASWSDAVARALYRSLVEVFAPEDG